MVKHENFKTCDQSGFCKRNRQYADAAAADAAWKSPYALDASSIRFDNGQLTGTVFKTLKNGEQVRLPVTVTFLETGVARVTLDEERRQTGDITLRHDSKARKERYDEAEKWAVVGSLKGAKDASLSQKAAKGTTVVSYGPGGAFQAIITHAPFGVSFARGGETHVQLNGRGLMNMEHWRPEPKKPEPAPEAPAVEGEAKEGEAKPEVEKPQEPKEAKVEEPPVGAEDTSTWWEESFGGAQDTKPRGPESVGLDIAFPGYDFVYGIPEHASSMALKQTRYGQLRFYDFADEKGAAKATTRSRTGCTIWTCSSTSSIAR
jgi:alpha 1,3-glucosidase